MNLGRNLLLAGALGSSVAASDDMHMVQANTSDRAADALHIAEGHHHSCHADIFAGFEHNHFASGQFMEGDFSTMSLHGGQNNFGAYYHWLRSEEGFQEHRMGAKYEYPLGNNWSITADASLVHESVLSNHGEDPHERSDGDEEADVHTGELEDIFYVPFSLEMGHTLFENERGETALVIGAETSFADVHTSLAYAGIDYQREFSHMRLAFSAKLMSILDTNSLHVEEGELGVLELGLHIPVGSSGTWSIDCGGQATTRGDNTGKFGVSYTF